MGENEEWVDATTIDIAKRYQVQLEIHSNRFRYREQNDFGYWGEWINGQHPEIDCNSD